MDVYFFLKIIIFTDTKNAQNKLEKLESNLQAIPGLELLLITV